jgi:superoxide reductase
MTGQKQIYKCDICGNVVEVLHSGEGWLVCCGQPMGMLVEKINEGGVEKHLPVIERKENRIKIKVGSEPHPMEETHYIEWIEAAADEKYCRKFLKPGDEPEAEFDIEAEKIKTRAYCNVHGLWKTEE